MALKVNAKITEHCNHVKSVNNVIWHKRTIEQMQIQIQLNNRGKHEIILNSTVLKKNCNIIMQSSTADI